MNESKNKHHHHRLFVGISTVFADHVSEWAALNMDGTRRLSLRVGRFLGPDDLVSFDVREVLIISSHMCSVDVTNFSPVTQNRLGRCHALFVPFEWMSHILRAQRTNKQVVKTTTSSFLNVDHILRCEMLRHD